MKKLIAILLTLAMILALAACDNETATPTTADPTASENSTETTESSETTQATEDATPKTETRWLIMSDTTVYEDEALGTNTNTYEYDDAGKLISVTQVMNGDTYSVTLDYSDEGLCTGMTMSQGDVTVRYEYTLDEAGNRVGTKAYMNGELSQTSSATYDDNGNMLTLKTSISGQETLIEYTYDDNGNMLRYQTSIGGVLYLITTAEYDAEDRCIKMTQADGEGNISLVTEITYEGYTETHVATTGDGTYAHTTVYTRDEHGNHIATECSGPLATPYTFTATYISIEVPVSE